MQAGGSGEGPHNISQRVVDEIKKVTYESQVPGGPKRVRIELAETGPDGKPVVLWKDSLVVSIGQDAKGEGGPYQLVKNFDQKLVPIFGEPQADGFKPVVGVQSPDGSVRVLGAAATTKPVSSLLDPSAMSSDEYQARLRKQADALGPDSKGVVQGFVLAQQNIEAANQAAAKATNAQLADALRETPDQQRTAEGLSATPGGDVTATTAP